MRIAQWSIPVLLLAILGIISYGPIQKQVRAAELTSANGNFKQIYVALSSYASDHDGLYPTDLESKSPTVAACFDELIQSGKIDEEETFWNKQNALTLNTASPSPPNNISPLTKNENTTGYVMGLTTPSPANLPTTFNSSTEAGVFNTSVWEGKAIVAKFNGSVKAMHISQISNSPNQQNEGYILERRGDSIVDIFKELPEGVKVLPPQLAN
ncbi:hypothetical protein BSZ32_07540 [Rubritalea profundi]|uniref:Uncharacterized protein n=2 Tax=Rubritalea profundi TaxID=1658618 RepID=A0A2S7U056_9BACT|nr:hypothetical protein BSZ32_07540 [Rubritalea profundi]